MSDVKSWESAVKRLEEADFQHLPAEEIFREDIIQALNRLKEEDFLRWARLKTRLSNHLNMNDLRVAMEQVD